MKNYGQVIHRTWDDSYVINNGMYHVPNEEAYKAQWEEIHAYTRANPDKVTEEQLYRPTLAELKEKALDLAREAFAARRDRVRYVDGYGYDCAAEDITNFMAAYTPLLVAGTGSVQYKVHLPDGSKGIVTLSADTMTRVYNTVRTSQFEDYAWYEDLRTRLDDAQTEEELTAILAEAGIAETDLAEANSTESAS